MKICEWCDEPTKEKMGIDNDGSWGVCGQCAFDFIQQQIYQFILLFKREWRFDLDE